MMVITGASSGLGAALTLLYSAENNPLLITGRNEQKLAEEQVKTNVFTLLSKSCFKIARTYLKRELIAQVLQFIFS